MQHQSNGITRGQPAPGLGRRNFPLTGKPLGVPYNGMTCTVLTLMLDGLTRQHRLKVKA